MSKPATAIMVARVTLVVFLPMETVILQYCTISELVTTEIPNLMDFY